MRYAERLYLPGHPSWDIEGVAESLRNGRRMSNVDHEIRGVTHILSVASMEESEPQDEEKGGAG